MLITKGIDTYFYEASNPHDDNAVPVQTLNVEGEFYDINPSHHEMKLSIIKEMENVLDSSSSPADAQKLLGAWAQLRKEREDGRARTFQQAQQSAAETYRESREQYETTVARKRQDRQLSITGIGLALASFVLLGLFLAVLAIERHTRLLEMREVASSAAIEHAV